MILTQPRSPVSFPNRANWSKRGWWLILAERRNCSQFKQLDVFILKKNGNRLTNEEVHVLWPSSAFFFRCAICNESRFTYLLSSAIKFSSNRPSGFSVRLLANSCDYTCRKSMGSETPWTRYFLVVTVCKTSWIVCTKKNDPCTL